jgi:hypothetical protein
VEGTGSQAAIEFVDAMRSACRRGRLYAFLAGPFEPPYAGSH